MTQEKEKALERAFEDAREKALLAFYEEKYDRWFASVKAKPCQTSTNSAGNDE